MQRDEVFKLIDEEREYQERRWPKPGHSHSVTEYLVYMRDYIETALHDVTHTNGDYAIRQNVRKIAALAVACMEEHNTPRREPRQWVN